MSHLLLLDASGFAYRAFHSRFSYRESDGAPTWAVLGFMEMTWKLLGRAAVDQPSHAVAVFDAPGRTFRHKIYPKYKERRRPGRDDELTLQLPVMRHAAQTLGIEPVELEGFEADDLIATYAELAKRRGWRTTIVSSDKDMCQLVVDGQVEIIEPVTRKRLRSAEVIEKFGVPPALVPDVQALAGDSVDDIPGVPGIGIETAAGLIRRFGSLDETLKGAKKSGEYMPGSTRAMLQRHARDARIYRRLTVLKNDVPGMPDLEDLELHPVMTSHLKEFLKVLGTPERFNLMFTNERLLARPATTNGHDPFDWWREEMAAPGQKVPAEPQCGFYQRRFVRKGAWAAVRIFLAPETDVNAQPTGSSVLRCEVNGKPEDPLRQWDAAHAHPIAEEDYRYRSEHHAWAKRYAPEEPVADPFKPIDILRARAPRNPKAAAQ